MIKVKNSTSGEVIKVWQTFFDKATATIYCNGVPSAKYLSKYPLMPTTEVFGDNGTVMKLNDGWEVVRGRAPKPVATEEPAVEEPAVAIEEAAPAIEKAAPAIEEAAPVEEAPVEPVVVTATAEVAKPKKDVGEYEAEIAATYGTMGVGIFRKAVEYVQANYTAALDESAVRRIASAIFAEYAEAQPEKMKAAKVAAKKAAKKANEVHCAKYDRILAKVSRGRRVYLHGPAGSGKSHTAEQIAADLGLAFYGQTTIQFAHDVRGYGDAGGNFQDTPFYKAFAFGGLYFQDEYDRSNAEAAIVLNSALANGWYDFPIVGRVEAHPNFRFMAAGNTLMKGADDGYITGQEIDPSSRDRFDFYFEVGYLREVELHIAHGNTEIVDFVEDVRQAIKACGIEHVVSYRATAAMADEVENENDLVACCEEGVFKGLDVDARREIYERLNNKTNVWANALKKTL